MPITASQTTGGQDEFGGGVSQPASLNGRANDNLPVKHNMCPFLHGTATVGPYPGGYIHGKYPEICPSGCKPLTPEESAAEAPLATLLREAEEYLTLYYCENKMPADEMQCRIKEVKAEIAATGTYTHTFDELQHGLRVAWRNAPKCSNRAFWNTLQLIDYRHATTNKEMFEGCLEMLERAARSAVASCNVVCFRPKLPGEHQGPRVWNNQLLRFAGWRHTDGNITGDPAEVAFTEMCMFKMGWAIPAEERANHTILPLVLQMDENTTPEMFKIPSSYIPLVPIHHPNYPKLGELGLVWYSIPAVSCLEFSVGGLIYTAAPFNGWYADTEITRNLTDEDRYNQCEKVAELLDLKESPIWKDAAALVLNEAVLHSFRKESQGIVEHNTMMDGFFEWYFKDKRERGYCPGNWKWIISPFGASLSKCYMRLNKMTEYTLKPAILPPQGGGWRGYKGNFPATFDFSQDSTKIVAGSFLAFRLACKLWSKIRAQRLKVTILYGSVTGNAKRYAMRTMMLLIDAFIVEVIDMAKFDPVKHVSLLKDSGAVLLFTSTYGSGEYPASARPFFTWLESPMATSIFSQKRIPTSVFGLGSSSYPRFCAAAELLYEMASTAGAHMMVPLVTGDANAGEEKPWFEWLCSTLAALHKEARASGAKKRSLQKIDELYNELVGARAASSLFKPAFALFIKTTENLSLEEQRARGVITATVASSTELLADPTPARSTKFIVLNVGDNPVNMTVPGDNACVYPSNPDELVQKVAAGLGLTNDLETMFLLKGLEPEIPVPFEGYTTFRTALTCHCGLTETISVDSLAVLSTFATSDTDVAKLKELSYDEVAYKKWVNTDGPRFGDVFDLFPSLGGGALPFPIFMQLVPSVKPRYYSIANAWKCTPGQIHLCVARLQYSLPSGQERSGLGSNFLCDVQPGDTVGVRVIRVPAFRHPIDSTAPVIMIGAGTGIAPLRSFWSERLYRAEEGVELGPAALFYGCRTKADALFANEMEECAQKGLLTPHIAYSREAGIETMYVQQLVEAQAEVIKPMLAHPKCVVLVCGTAAMAVGVEEKMEAMIGAKALKEMKLDGYYMEDCFGSGA